MWARAEARRPVRRRGGRGVIWPEHRKNESPFSEVAKATGGADSGDDREFGFGHSREDAEQAVTDTGGS